MIRVFTSVSALVLATAANAHDGVHLHPHSAAQGWDATGLAIGLTASAILIAAFVLPRLVRK